MKRYDYFRRQNKKNRQIYLVFDRHCGTGVWLAKVYDVTDAEKICAALNQRENGQ